MLQWKVGEGGQEVGEEKEEAEEAEHDEITRRTRLFFPLVGRCVMFGGRGCKSQRGGWWTWMGWDGCQRNSVQGDCRIGKVCRRLPGHGRDDHRSKSQTQSRLDGKEGNNGEAHACEKHTHLAICGPGPDQLDTSDEHELGC